MKTKVLLVDDQPIVRRGLRMVLNLEIDFEVVGEAQDGAEALVLAENLLPNVIVLDVAMPVMDGIACTRALKNIAPDAAVVILSLHDDQETRTRAFAAGAAAFVPKAAPLDFLIAALREAVGRGDAAGNP